LRTTKAMSSVQAKGAFAAAGRSRARL